LLERIILRRPADEGSLSHPKQRKIVTRIALKAEANLLERALGAVWRLVWREAPVQTARAQAVGRRWNGQTDGRESRFAEGLLREIIFLD